VVSSTPRPHFTPGKEPVPIVQEAGWAPWAVWTDGKSRPHRDSFLDPPARSSVTIPTELPPDSKRWQVCTGKRRRMCSGVPLRLQAVRWPVLRSAVNRTDSPLNTTPDRVQSAVCLSSPKITANIAERLPRQVARTRCEQFYIERSQIFCIISVMSPA